MAGDPLRDAFRGRLAAHLVAAAIPWPVQDTLNTGTNPDASAGFFELEFPGGTEAQYTFGAPGANFFREEGQVTVYAKTPLAAGTTLRDLAETYAAAVRAAFRNDRFAAGAATVRITAVAPMGGGHDEAGLWAEAVALGYEIYVLA